MEMWMNGGGGNSGPAWLWVHESDTGNTGLSVRFRALRLLQVKQGLEMRSLC